MATNQSQFILFYFITNVSNTLITWVLWCIILKEVTVLPSKNRKLFYFTSNKSMETQKIK